MRDYKAIADRLIKNARWYHVRGRVRRALESAYQDGLNDAANEVSATGDELAGRIRDLATSRSDRAVEPPRSHPLPH